MTSKEEQDSLPIWSQLYILTEVCSIQGVSLKRLQVAFLNDGLMSASSNSYLPFNKSIIYL